MTSITETGATPSIHLIPLKPLASGQLGALLLARPRTSRLAPRSDGALAILDRIPNVQPIPLDITDRSAIAALRDQLPGALDGVVNDAGIIVNGPVEGTDGAGPRTCCPRACLKAA